MANKELELKQEKVRLEETIQTVKALIQGVDSLEESQRKEAQELLHNLSYSDINQQLGIMTTSAQNEEDAQNRRRQYLRALKSPYFCRIDFAEEHAKWFKRSFRRTDCSGLADPYC